MAITKTVEADSTGQPGAPDFLTRVQMVIGGDNYATNGLPFDPVTPEAELIALEGREIIAVIPMPNAGYVPEYDYAAKKMKVFYSDLSESTDGPMIEFPASALTATFQVFIAAK